MFQATMRQRASKARTGQETACRLHVSEYGWGDVACLKYNETELE